MHVYLFCEPMCMKSYYVVNNIVMLQQLVSGRQRNGWLTVMLGANSSQAKTTTETLLHTMLLTTGQYINCVYTTYVNSLVCIYINNMAIQHWRGNSTLNCRKLETLRLLLESGADLYAVNSVSVWLSVFMRFCYSVCGHYPESAKHAHYASLHSLWSN